MRDHGQPQHQPPADDQKNQTVAPLSSSGLTRGSSSQDQSAEMSNEELNQLQIDLQKARESELRAMADYQNLVRRTQEDYGKMAKFANLTLIESLLQPLEHLFLAKEQLKDQGLNMVYQQFMQVMQEEGLEEINALGKEFDPATMEVVNKEDVTKADQVNKVVKVTQRGFRLHGDVIRHAKVVVGEMAKKN
jgi:molecular chaperone GrpE